MSDFSVLRTADAHPKLRYCLVLDGDRIAGGKPDYRGNNHLISWRTSETYGPVDELTAENAKLRELCARAYKCARHSDHATCDECIGMHGGCTLLSAMRELGVEEARA